MISKTLAEKFIEQVTECTPYNVNIMDGEGIIIASRDPERLGQYHEIAYRIIHGQEDIVDTTKIGDYTNVLPGINMVIAPDGIREGVVGVTGEPEEIRPVALMVKMAMESMLRYEKQQESIRLRENRKERFVHLLTEVEGADPEELRSLAAELNYPEERIRIPVLAVLNGSVADEFLFRIKKNNLHSQKDLSLALDEHRVIIFKTMPDDATELFSEYKYIIGEYLSTVLRWMKENNISAKLYVGSFQDSYARYYYAYRHCRWLQDNIQSNSGAVFFYDHVKSYLNSVIPMRELTHIFYIYESRFPEKKTEEFLETNGALIEHGFNFNKASNALFIHKNTLVYRYNKWKELMDIDPVANPQDMGFLEAFYEYLMRKRASDK